MKKERGITLISLVVYVIVMSIMLVVISSIINQFYQNTDSIEASTEQILAFNTFNTYFLKEVKTKGNSIDHMQDTYVLFKTGNSFSYADGKLYYNKMQICQDVQQFTMEQEEDNENIINITLAFEEFTKSMRYKIEEID